MGHRYGRLDAHDDRGNAAKVEKLPAWCAEQTVRMGRDYERGQAIGAPFKDGGCRPTQRGPCMVYSLASILVVMKGGRNRGIGQ
jgi:hypothetical protein